MLIIKDDYELQKIVGGLDVSGSVLNAFATGIKTLFDIGRSFGTAIRRVFNGNLCAIN